MLNYDLRFDDGILVLEPEGPLGLSDFATIARHIDTYLESHGRLHGMLIRARKFPGWQDSRAMVAHLKFVGQYHRKIEKIAVVSDNAAATSIPRLAGQFLRAEIRHFSRAAESVAWDWLSRRDRAQIPDAA